MKKSPLRRIIEIVAFVLIGIVMSLLVFVIVSGSKGNVAFLFGRAVVWVKTDSMEPTVPERSYILVERIDPEKVEVGDVILFRSDDPEIEGSYNTHRVVEIIGDHEEFVTRGDHNPLNDQVTAKAEKIEAVFRRNLPLLSRFGRFFTTQIGMMSAGAMVLILLMAIYIPDMRRFAAYQEAEARKKKEAEIERLVKGELEKLKAAGEKPPEAGPPAVSPLEDEADKAASENNEEKNEPVLTDSVKESETDVQEDETEKGN